MKPRMHIGRVVLPPDPLCKWLGNRWETMQELATALEREQMVMQDDKRVRAREKRVERYSIGFMEQRKIRWMLELAEGRRHGIKKEVAA